MEFLFLLAVVVIVGVPVIAVVALVRAENVRKLLNSRYEENLATTSNLRREFRELQQLVRAYNHPTTASATSSATVSSETNLPDLVSPNAAERPILSSFQNTPIEHPGIEMTESIKAATLESLEPLPVHNPAPPFTVTVEEPALESAKEDTSPTPAKPSFAYKATTAVPPPPPSFPAEKDPALQGESRKSTGANYGAPRYEDFKHRSPRKSIAERLRATLPLEEVLGMNLFAKIGIVLLVMGFALFGRVALIAMGPLGKVAMLTTAAIFLLGGGIWLERKERYRLIGRTGIGGGWALLFFTTYAMYHVSAMRVLQSETFDCILLLIVAIAMVVHTLRYRSQLVTGLAFLLAFSTVALSQDTVYSLAAGVILALGIIAIALRMGWYEIEVFGILASYANHFYWLYKLYPEGVAGHLFAQFWPSTIILIMYWLIFRISYVARGIRIPRDERTSTIAAILNTTLLLVVMKFQSTRPELAFYALLALGALEFLFGQLPATRQRRPAFILLTVMGTGLMLAAVPFKFGGNSIALLWIIAAEALLVAGIAQTEILFRRLGLVIGIFTGALIAYQAMHLVQFRQHSELPLLQNGILLLTCAALFYINSYFICRKWEHLFKGFDEKLALVHSYLGATTAFLGCWGVFTHDWTAVAWAVLMLSAALCSRWLRNKDLLLQSWLLALAVATRTYFANCHFTDHYPHHLTIRLIAIPVLSLLFYLTGAVMSGEEDLRAQLRLFSLWAGSTLLATLIWLEVAPDWVALGWMALAVVLLLVRRRVKISTFSYQEHVLALLAAFQLISVNLFGQDNWARYISFIGCATILYAVSRFCTFKEDAQRHVAAWTHTWIATILLATLAWHESQQPWLAVIWAGFALALATADRMFKIEELPFQAHALAALAVLRAVTLNLYDGDKWHRIDIRLITVSILVAVLYALARWVRIPETLRKRDFHHAYSWSGSFLTAWMLWCELQPISVALGLAVFGLLLFECGSFKQLRQIRLQAYVALAAAFVRIFFINLTVTRAPGELISPAVLTVLPISLIYFFVWAQLQRSGRVGEREQGSVGNAIAYFGTGCIVSLLYFQMSAEWVIATWAAVVFALLVTTLVLDRELFLQQAALLVIGIVTRGIAHNIFGGSYFSSLTWHGNSLPLALTATLLFAALPIAFRLQTRYAERPTTSFLGRYLLLDRPEQLLFFAPVAFVTLMIAVKMNPGMVTLSWGLEGVLVILLGLAVGQRTYRITGLLLLLLCVAKIVLRDAWHLAERDRYITFIVLGTALTLVSMLYNRYRETVRRLL